MVTLPSPGKWLCYFLIVRVWIGKLINIFIMGLEIVLANLQFQIQIYFLKLAVCNTFCNTSRKGSPKPHPQWWFEIWPQKSTRGYIYKVFKVRQFSLIRNSFDIPFPCLSLTVTTVIVTPLVHIGSVCIWNNDHSVITVWMNTLHHNTFCFFTNLSLSAFLCTLLSGHVYDHEHF